MLLPARGRCACGARTQGWVLRRLQRRDGGEPCIVRTRIPVWLLVQARHLGTSEADLLRAYPALRAEDLANAWAYARAHADEIERQVRENEAA